MGKPKMIGIQKPYIPNTGTKRNNPFIKKKTKKK